MNICRNIMICNSSAGGTWLTSLSVPSLAKIFRGGQLSGRSPCGRLSEAPSFSVTPPNLSDGRMYGLHYRNITI